MGGAAQGDLPSLPELLRKLWHHVGPRRRRQFTLLFCLMLLSGFAEILSLGAILPFIAALAAPEKVMEYGAVASFASYIGIASAEELVLPLTLVFASAVLLAGAFRITVIWINTRLTFATGADLSIEVYRRALYQPYHVHVLRSSSEMISGVTGKIGHTTLGVLLPCLTICSSLVLLIAIMTALIVIDPVLAVAATLGFASCYGVISWFARRRLNRNSRIVAQGQTQVVKALQEGLGGIRDVLLNGTQPVYCDVYRQADKRWRMAQGENVFIGQSPRFMVEALGMILIAGLAYAISGRAGGIAAALPVLGALAMGAQRLLPAMQLAYNAWASIAGSHGSFADTIELLDQPLRDEMLQAPKSALPFNREIRFDGVSFRYAEDGPWVLDGFDLRVPRGARVGIVGSTGSGKSTLLDLLMGLLTPTSGSILVDDVSIHPERVRSWQCAIAHVPQSIFLSDASLAENIALGVRPEDIDIDRVRHAARQAQIAEFIESGPDGYNAVVGERGVRLSGGQRQRIGIARALYKKASVLVLDEATSALDNATEQSIIDAIEGLDRELTIFIIAHRLTTVERCDSIVELEQGRAIGQGTYTELIERSESFRQMAEARS